jgi:hypothetical protein
MGAAMTQALSSEAAGIVFRRCRSPALNHVPFTRLLSPLPDGEQHVLFLSGDDPAAKAGLRSVLQANNFAVIDLGNLATGSRLQQVGSPLGGLDLRPFLVDSGIGLGAIPSGQINALIERLGPGPSASDSLVLLAATESGRSVPSAPTIALNINQQYINAVESTVI